MKVRKFFNLLATAAMLLALVVVPVFAQVVNDINFEIDGNTAADEGADDWETVILGGPPAWDQGPATLIQDGNSGPKSAKPEENIFATGGKFGDLTTWNIKPGNVPAQNDLTNVYVNAYAGNSVSGDSWIVMGMHRIKKQGTFDLDFEFNQVAWDGQSQLVRTEGDLVAGFELSGNPTSAQDLQVLILYYKPDDPDCNDEPFFNGAAYGAGFCEIFRGPASAISSFGVATMNLEAFNQPPWGAFDTDGSVLAADEQVQPFFFAEAAINLSALGIDLECPGFGSVHAKSRSSLEVTADLKDLAGPVAFSVACYIDGYKWHDLNADGVWDAGEPPLEGWQIDLLDGGSVIDTTYTLADGSYLFDGLSSGTFTVQEVCPADWIQSFPAQTLACGDGTHTFTINLNTPTASGDFGNYQNGTVSGFKFKDADNNGLFDGIDAGLPGWTINVYADDGDGVLGAGDTAAGTYATGADGSYSFSLSPGKYIFCEVAQTNWTQTAPANTVCGADPFGEGLADGGHAITVASGGLYSATNFGNTPLSDFDVNFYDLTGFTDATITCVDAQGNPVGSANGDTVTASGVTIGEYTCTITIVDP